MKVFAEIPYMHSGRDIRILAVDQRHIDRLCDEVAHTSSPSVEDECSHSGSSSGSLADSSGDDPIPDVRPVSSESEPVRLAVYDFDGTSINGSSPTLLVANLARRKDIGLITIWRILLWGAAYKLHLPLNQEHARELVFTAFKGKPKEQVDAYLAQFYKAHIAKRFRPAASRSMKRIAASGDVVMIVSASFEPIIMCAKKDHPYISYQLSTRMAVDSRGRYTGKVEGRPVAGAHKLDSVCDFANKTYGEGNWMIDYAFGDHHSDEALLRSARHAYAVNPDSTLTKAAKENEWPILDWSFESRTTGT